MKSLFIFRVLIHLDEGLCDLSGMCPASSNAVSTFSGKNFQIVYKVIHPKYYLQPFSAKAVVGGDIQCEFCEKVIQHWIDTWTSDTTQVSYYVLY